MKKIVSLFSILLIATAGMLVAQNSVQEEAKPEKLLFDKTTHDFGTLKEGDPAVYTFKFTNKSNKDISLLNVKPSCGCTTPSYTKDIVKPGATGEIQISYATTGRPGPINKSITVTYDTTEQPIYLFIRGDVVKPEAPATEPTAAPAPPANDGHNHDGHNHEGHNHEGHNHGNTPAQPKSAQIIKENRNLYQDLLMASMDVKFNSLATLKHQN